MYKGCINMDKIIFVCTGNTCRSPMAEAIARKIFSDKNKNIDVCSRGISVFFEMPANDNAIKALKKYNIDLKNHVSKAINSFEIKEYNLILTMTNSHKHALISMFPDYKNKIDTLYHYTFNIEKDINDPYGYDLQTYINCCDEIYDCILKI